MDRRTSIRASQLRNFELTGEDIKDNSIPGSKLIDNTISGSKLAESYLKSNDDGIIYGNLTISGTNKQDGAFYAGSVDPTNSTRLNYDGYFYATRVYNAVYNDVADFQPSKDIYIPGKCYYMSSEGLKLCNKKCQKGIVGIASDTFGFSLGNSNNTIPIAVAGWVLAYVDEKCGPGDLLTSNEKGNLVKINRIYKFIYPERIIAIYDRPELNEFIGPRKQIKVNNRHWVKVL